MGQVCWWLTLDQTVTRLSVTQPLASKLRAEQGLPGNGRTINDAHNSHIHTHTHTHKPYMGHRLATKRLWRVEERGTLIHTRVVKATLSYFFSPQPYRVLIVFERREWWADRLPHWPRVWRSLETAAAVGQRGQLMWLWYITMMRWHGGQLLRIFVHMDLT